MRIPTVAEARKFLAALAALVAEAVTLGVLSGTVEHWVTVGIAAAGAVLVYVLPNEQGKREPVTADAVNKVSDEVNESLHRHPSFPSKDATTIESTDPQA